jgi:hypothetical protein
MFILGVWIMAKKRMLNQDYYKLDAKLMRKNPSFQEGFKQNYRIMEIKPARLKSK